MRGLLQYVRRRCRRRRRRLTAICLERNAIENVTLTQSRQRISIG
jgi:hypothetical protein